MKPDPQSVIDEYNDKYHPGWRTRDAERPDPLLAASTKDVARQLAEALATIDRLTREMAAKEEGGVSKIPKAWKSSTLRTIADYCGILAKSSEDKSQKTFEDWQQFLSRLADEHDSA